MKLYTIDLPKDCKLYEILQIQHVQVLKLMYTLNDECMLALIEKVKNENKKLTVDSDPFSVFRGTSLECFVANWKPDNKEKYVLNFLNKYVDRLG